MENQNNVTPPTRQNDKRASLYDTKLEMLEEQIANLTKAMQSFQAFANMQQPNANMFPYYQGNHPFMAAPAEPSTSSMLMQTNQTNYSSDYEEMVVKNQNLQAEIDGLQEKLQYTRDLLAQREYVLGTLDWEGADFKPGQVNRNIQLEINHAITQPYRFSLKYPVRCTCSYEDKDHYIFDPEDAYDDTYPVGTYGKDIFCKKCFNKYVMPKRIELAKQSSWSEKKNKSKEQA